MLSHCRHFAPVLRSGVAHSLHYHPALTHATRTACGVLRLSEALYSTQVGPTLSLSRVSGRADALRVWCTPTRGWRNSAARPNDSPAPSAVRRKGNAAVKPPRSARVRRTVWTIGQRSCRDTSVTRKISSGGTSQKATRRLQRMRRRPNSNPTRGAVTTKPKGKTTKRAQKTRTKQTKNAMRRSKEDGAVARPRTRQETRTRASEQEEKVMPLSTEPRPPHALLDSSPAGSLSSPASLLWRRATATSPKRCAPGGNKYVPMKVFPTVVVKKETGTTLTPTVNKKEEPLTETEGGTTVERGTGAHTHQEGHSFFLDSSYFSLPHHAVRTSSALSLFPPPLAGPAASCAAARDATMTAPVFRAASDGPTSRAAFSSAAELGDEASLSQWIDRKIEQHLQSQPPDEHISSSAAKCIAEEIERYFQQEPLKAAHEDEDGAEAPIGAACHFPGFDHTLSSEGTSKPPCWPTVPLEKCLHHRHRFFFQWWRVIHAPREDMALTHATRTACGVLRRSEALSSSARGALTEQLPFSGHIPRCAALFTPSRCDFNDGFDAVTGVVRCRTRHLTLSLLSSQPPLASIHPKLSVRTFWSRISSATWGTSFCSSSLRCVRRCLHQRSFRDAGSDTLTVQKQSRDGFSDFQTAFPVTVDPSEGKETSAFKVFNSSPTVQKKKKGNSRRVRAPAELTSMQVLCTELAHPALVESDAYNYEEDESFAGLHSEERQYFVEHGKGFAEEDVEVMLGVAERAVSPLKDAGMTPADHTDGREPESKAFSALTLDNFTASLTNLDGSPLLDVSGLADLEEDRQLAMQCQHDSTPSSAAGVEGGGRGRSAGRHGFADEELVKEAMEGLEQAKARTSDGEEELRPPPAVTLAAGLCTPEPSPSREAAIYAEIQTEEPEASERTASVLAAPVPPTRCCSSSIHCSAPMTKTFLARAPPHLPPPLLAQAVHEAGSGVKKEFTTETLHRSEDASIPDSAAPTTTTNFRLSPSSTQHLFNYTEKVLRKLRLGSMAWSSLPPPQSASPAPAPATPEMDDIDAVGEVDLQHAALHALRDPHAEAVVNALLTRPQPLPLTSAFVVKPPPSCSDTAAAASADTSLSFGEEELREVPLLCAAVGQRKNSRLLCPSAALPGERVLGFAEDVEMELEDVLRPYGCSEETCGVSMAEEELLEMQEESEADSGPH